MTLAFWLLIFARVAPIVALHPIFGGRSLPRLALAGIAATLTTVIALAAPQPVPPGRMIGLLAEQLAVGSSIGVLGLLVFGTLESAGRLIDDARGAGTAQYYVPQLESFSSPMARLEVQSAVAVFWAAGLHRPFIACLADSFLAIPIVANGAHAFGALELADTARSLVAAGVSIAGPAMIGCLLADIALGFAARAAPQAHALSLGLPLKLAVAVGLTAMALPSRVGIWPELWSNELEWIRRISGH